MQILHVVITFICGVDLKFDVPGYMLLELEQFEFLFFRLLDVSSERCRERFRVVKSTVLIQFDRFGLAGILIGVQTVSFAAMLLDGVRPYHTSYIVV
mmetsp:Transcript_47239/g.62524  ORF Transcript_47239/g.62524 Transcript_47239/m.62524 type:complete len:97 (+) Transcript_47239:197-487(+)